jgi:hypothetical protein
MRADTNIATAFAPVSHRESDDAYHAVVARLNGSWRVIACKDGIQWILQRRRGERRGGARFDSRSYCRTREALIRVCREHAGEISPSAMAVLEALPRMIGIGDAK